MFLCEPSKLYYFLAVFLIVLAQDKQRKTPVPQRPTTKVVADTGLGLDC